MKQKKIFNGDLISSGFILGLGSSAIEKLPNSTAKTGVLSGVGTMGSYYPTMANLHVTGFMLSQLKNLGNN